MPDLPLTADLMNARLDRLERRQEALIGSVDTLVDVVIAVRDGVGELLAWAQAPPSSDLPDTLAKLAECVSGLQEAIVAQARELPGQVADEVQRRCR